MRVGQAPVRREVDSSVHPSPDHSLHNWYCHVCRQCHFGPPSGHGFTAIRRTGQVRLGQAPVCRAADSSLPPLTIYSLCTTLGFERHYPAINGRSHPRPGLCVRLTRRHHGSHEDTKALLQDAANVSRKPFRLAASHQRVAAPTRAGQAGHHFAQPGRPARPGHLAQPRTAPPSPPPAPLGPPQSGPITLHLPFGLAPPGPPPFLPLLPGDVPPVDPPSFWNCGSPHTLLRDQNQPH